jgi:hypothetical protein
MHPAVHARVGAQDHDITWLFPIISFGLVFLIASSETPPVPLEGVEIVPYR